MLYITLTISECYNVLLVLRIGFSTSHNANETTNNKIYKPMLIVKMIENDGTAAVCLV